MKTKANRIEWLLGVLILAWPAQAQYGGGTGEPNDPYLIYTPEQMNQIGLHQQDWHSHFKLMADIDLSRYTATQFNIIGYYRSQKDRESFHGVFDGNGHTISNFTYVSQSAETVGIFDTISGKLAEIRDLGLIDPNVHAEAGSAITTLVSYLEGGTIRNCYVRGGSVTGGNVVGGLVGYNLFGRVVNCYASTRVSGDGNVGGLVADNLEDTGPYFASTVANCYSTSNVSGNEHVGGLMGSNRGIVFNCFWDVETSG